MLMTISHYCTKTSLLHAPRRGTASHTRAHHNTKVTDQSQPLKSAAKRVHKTPADKKKYYNIETFTETELFLKKNVIARVLSLG